MRLISVLIILIFLLSCQDSPQSRIECFTLTSKIFGNERKLRVYLPPGYDQQKAYKVLYLNDGQNLFDTLDGQFSNAEWRVDEAADSLISNRLIEPLIIVGIDNAGKDRPNEYLPWEDIYLNPPLPNPQGNLYPDFLTKEVMPLIENKYQVKKGRINTGLGGTSFGGLISTYTLLKNPDLFGFTIIESPSLYVGDQKILEVAKNSPIQWPERVYLGIGTNELALQNCGEDNADNLMAVNDVLMLQEIINLKSPSSNVKVLVDSCAIHHESAWAKRFPHALKFIMGTQL